MFLIQKRTPKRQTSRVTQPSNVKTLKGPEGPKNIPQVSIGKWIFDHLIKHHNKNLIVDCETGREWTGKQIHDCAYNLAIALIEKFGLKTGDPVCFYAPTQTEYIIGVIAVWTAGGVFTGCDPKFPETELYNVIEDTKARFIITSRENQLKSRSVAEKLKHISQIKQIIQIEDLENYFAFYDQDIYYNTYYDSNNQLLPNSSKFMSAVMFTSGTTGRPKPIIRGHSDLIYSSIELQDNDLLGLNGDSDCASFNMPIFHSGGLYYLLHFLIAGCKMACFSGYNEDKFLSYVEKYKITIAFLLHSNLTQLVTSDEKTSRYDLSSLKEVFYDGANLIEGIATSAVNKFSLKHIRQVAGQSEIGWVAICPRSLSVPETKSVGLPVPGIEIKITELETGRALPPFKIGEIRIKSHFITKGYLNRPQKLTENLFDREGFVKTGDAGYYDESGFLYHVDRVCWLIRCAGNILIASHLESIISRHDSVSEAVVIPVESEKFGQLPKAFITVKHNYCVTEQDIIDYLSDKIEGSYKSHIRVTILDQMPISPNGRGRIRKGQLIKMVSNQL